jgi:uncharacterized membrane protein
MNKRIGLVLILAVVLAGFVVSNSFTRSENYNDVWWNSSWHYRIRFEVNHSQINRTDWPVEYQMNFTYLLENMSVSGTFDNLSVRLVEYNDSDGSILHELPVQFDPDGNYDAASSATGEVVFILNGTMYSNNSDSRFFYLYFDTVENGQKQERNWSFQETGYNMSRTWNGEVFMINNTNYLFYFDTDGGENTSGLFRIYDIPWEEENFIYSTGSARTREYLKFTNGSHNFTWYLNGSANFTMGPVRITVTQEGDEIYWNEPGNETDETSIVKKYYFYPNIQWYRMELNVTNTGAQAVDRGAELGAPKFDASLAYNLPGIFDQNKTDPASFLRVYSTTNPGHELGIILENESVSNFHVDNDSSIDYVGINLSSVNIPADSFLWLKSIFVSGHSTRSPDIVYDVRDGILTPIEVAVSAAEKWILESHSQTNYTVYNRNETVLLWINITIDGWNLTNHTNATLDMGTPSTSDDVNIILHDDGDSGHGDQEAGDNVWSNLYALPNDSAEGEWNLTARIYNNDSHLLNESYYIFNVTAQFYVSLLVDLPSGGLPNREVNATLWAKNYRQDTGIPNAEDVNCTFYYKDTPNNKTNVDNITDNGNGSYRINFTAPSEIGLYYLNCTVVKDGNNGTDYDNFGVESPTTNVSLSTSPISKTLTNVTWYDNETFLLTITMDNTGNGTAYNPNITLSVPQNFTTENTSYFCNDTLASLSCVWELNVTALATSTNETYEFNITINWTNPDDSTDYNYTTFNVTIAQNPIMVVDTDNLSARVGPGFEKQMGTMNANSTGNYRIEDVNFTVTGLEDFQFIFNPTGPISYINPGGDQDVTVTVNVSSDHAPGIFNGTLNVSTSNDGFHIINLTVIVSGTNVSINVTPGNFTTDIVNWYVSDYFNLSVNTTNIGLVTAFDTEINLSMDLNYFNATNGTTYDCGNVSVGSSCNLTYNFTVMNGTPAGNYTINVTVSWEETDIGTVYNWSIVNVTVTSNITLEVDKTSVAGSLEHGTNGSFGNVTVLSAGNDVVYNVTLNLTGLENFSANLSSEGPYDLSTGQSQFILLNATIPFAYPPGIYNGTLNITSNNAENFSLNVSLTVPVNGSWYVNETQCEHSQSPDEGVACVVLVNNTGNVLLDFNVTPSELNHTNVSTTNFTVNASDEYELIFYYNVTGIAGQSTWTANYTINATNLSAEPDEIDVKIIMSPYIKPLVDAEVIPNSTEQLGSVLIYSNVTAQSDRPILMPVNVTVTRPDGTNDTVSMTRLYWQGCTGSGPGSTSCWYAYYPSTWGNTTYMGNYTAYVYAEDDLGENETGSDSFYVYTKLNPLMFTLSDEYSNQGYQGSVYYRSKDVSGEVIIGNVSVDVIILNPDNETTFNNSYVTESDGFIRNDYNGIYIDFPTYGYPAGNYTILVNSTYYEEQPDLYVNSTQNYTFTMVDHPPSYGIHADMRIYPLWYQNSIMKFVMWFTDSSGMLTDPDNISLYVTNPADQPYFSTTKASMIKESTGVYTYSFAMPPSAPIGIYDVVLNASIGGYYTVAYDYIRVSMGGPYDVDITIDESDKEVEPGDIVNFEIYVENMGDVDNADVLIEYWVSGGGQTWDYQHISANIRAGENKTFDASTDPSVSAYVFTSQPPGGYVLNLKVTYDSVHNLYATSNDTFEVIGEAPAPPPSGDEGGEPEGAGPGGGGQAILNITEYDKEVGVEVGVIRYVNIAVKNTGDAAATNVQLTARSTEENWFLIEPKNVGSLAAGEEVTFTIKILVPFGIESGQHEVMITATSNQSDDTEIFTLFVFTSRKELIDFELVRLKARLRELKTRTENAKAAGYDVSPVEDLIKDIENEIELAENYLQKELYDAALDAVYNAWQLIKEAEDLLEDILARGLLPWWVILIIVFGVVIAVLVVFMRRMMKNLRILLRGRLSEARQVAGAVKPKGDVDILRTEKSKNQRMLGLLESQYRSGIISKDAYESMRKRSEEKINEIDRKIREALK